LLETDQHGHRESNPCPLVPHAFIAIGGNEACFEFSVNTSQLSLVVLSAVPTNTKLARSLSRILATRAAQSIALESVSATLRFVHLLLRRHFRVSAGSEKLCLQGRVVTISSRLSSPCYVSNLTLASSVPRCRCNNKYMASRWTPTEHFCC
jgi:hypothetical protein